MATLKLGQPIARHAAASMPGDKSISHRALVLAAVARGTTTICGLNEGDDVARTRRAIAQLGAGIRTAGPATVVTGMRQPTSTCGVIDCGNSGTTMRLLMGLLAGRGATILDGDRSLRGRPMARVARPLRRMGAVISTAPSGRPPVRLEKVAGRLRGIDYTMPFASAQVRSALLLAGIGADGVTRVHSPLVCRDHTERLLEAMGARIARVNNSVAVEQSALRPIDRLQVPGDLSAAVYCLCAAASAAAGRLSLRDVGINPTRSAALEAMRSMGVWLVVRNERNYGAEPVADIEVAGGAPLRGVELRPDDIPNLIDDVPALCALAAVASGTTVVRGAAELRVKESDRIAAIVDVLTVFGADAAPTADGLIVRGGRTLRAPHSVRTGGDHRIGMMAALLGVATASPIEIEDADCIATSFPGFGPAWKALFIG